MKKIFRLTAMAAMVSMLATTATFTSCSDDDDDDDPNPIQQEDVKYTNVFSVKVGGTSSSEGSFISVQEGKVYKSSELTDDNKVEIIFDGDKFSSASESKNDKVNQNGCGALIKTIVKGEKYSFTTEGGENGKSYSGIIEVTDGKVGGASATVTIKVSAK